MRAGGAQKKKKNEVSGGIVGDDLAMRVIPGSYWCRVSGDESASIVKGGTEGEGKWGGNGNTHTSTNSTILRGRRKSRN